MQFELFDAKPARAPSARASWGVWQERAGQDRASAPATAGDAPGPLLRPPGLDATAAHRLLRTLPCRMCHTEADPQQAQPPEAAAAGAGGAAPPAVPPLGPGGGERVYRLASVGQDCQLALWDVVVSEEAVAAAQQASSAK